MVLLVSCFLTTLPLFLKFKMYLSQVGISSHKYSMYYPSRNGQNEKTVQTIWKTIQLTLKTAGLPPEIWEIILPKALHSIRSLLCTATNATAHNRFFAFPKSSSSRTSLTRWMTYLAQRRISDVLFEATK